MKREKDIRVTGRFTNSGEYALILGILMSISGLNIWLFIVVMEADLSLAETIIAMVGYLVVIALIVALGYALFRRINLGRPLRQLSEAARNIAQGDFSLRLKPRRKDGKKDYVDVLFDDFNTMAEELGRIETLKDDFIATVSHEIKTPLSIIQGYAMALQNSGASPVEQREYIETILDASRRLSALVSNILKLNKLENQGIIPARKPYDLGEQIRRCALNFEELWERKSITFRADLEEVLVSWDDSLLELVWNNLISNAVKFTSSGGLLTLTLKADGAAAVVTLTDTGCGMDEKTRRRIFDKFFQGDTSHSQEGNGLGLALVKKALDLLGGTIDAASELGEGTTFTVRLRGGETPYFLS